MSLGAAALPPPAYVAFCERQPLDCGGDAGQVLSEARQADADRAALMAMLSPAAARTSAASPAALSSAAIEPPQPAPEPEPEPPHLQLLPVGEPLEATLRPASFRTQIDFIEADARERAAEAAGRRP